jgi:8-oxo-dGTP pyrophosphatase MutT (NUDIX family)
VLVPLVERPGGLTVLLTRRTDHLRDHPGQISFPGGRLDANDSGPREAALRETTEELGIPGALVEIAGYLPPHAVVTGFAVTPVVGFLPDSLVLSPDAFEVAEAFEIPLAFLLDPLNVVAGTRRVAGVDIPVWEFHYRTHRVWGATAQILKSLVQLIDRT